MSHHIRIEAIYREPFDIERFVAALIELVGLMEDTNSDASPEPDSEDEASHG